MASHDNGNTITSASSGKWPDLYALLGVPPDANEELLRQRIRESYIEATANSDHRNMDRRIHYQSMVERILPQCRRILLNNDSRAAYDQQTELHRQGLPGAIDYATFVNTAASGANPVHDDAENNTLPGKVVEPTRSEARRADEMAQARAILESLGGADEAAMPGASAASAAVKPESIPSVIETDALPAIADEIPTQVLPTETVQTETLPRQDLPVRDLPTQQLPTQPASPVVAQSESPVPAVAAPTPAAEPQLFSTPQQAAETPQSPLAARVLEMNASGHASPPVERAAPGNGQGTLEHDNAPRAQVLYAPRVTVDEAELASRTAARKKANKRVLSPVSVNVLVAIVAGALVLAILHFTDPANNVAASSLRITYASELQPFMERAEREFEKTEAGKAIDVQLSPIDSRMAMQDALGQRGTPPDVWIPSETLWSDRYNQVAQSNGRQVIKVARSFALSPMVLVARSEHAAILRQRFPSRMIPSWDALRSAVLKGAPGHFGLTDPQVSGSGAIARLFMAREWSDRNGIAWGPQAVANPNLWRWMSGFEDSVPGYAKLAGDMVKDLALGTADRYWWAIAYESDALHWMQQKKPVEVFYLPRTNYADHPYCYVERPGIDPRMVQARVQFEQFLRSEPMQKILLQSGFRPTEIEVTGGAASNPFTSAQSKQRGVRVKGFRIDDRINYKILNNLNVQWAKRF